MENRDTFSLLSRYFEIMFDFAMERDVEWVKNYYHSLFGAKLDKCTPSNKQNPYLKLLLIAENGLCRGELSNTKSASFYANFWIYLVHGIFMDWCLNNGNTDLRHDIEEIIQYCCDVSRPL